jgi:general stress protein 26
MKNIFLFFFLLTFTNSLIAQQGQFPPQREVSRDSLLIYARTIVDSAQCRALVTVDEEGNPRVREMSPFPPDDDWIIWLGTFPTSRKANQIKNKPNVVVFYYDSDGYSYVAVSGKAQLVNDPNLKEKYWKEGWKRFYPDRDTQYILIKVVPERLEVCSFKYHLLWDSEGRPVSVKFGDNENK